jgi:hypothetical protein
MKQTREQAVERAKEDLARRLSTSVESIKVSDVTDTDFPDMSLGAPAADEMAAQVIATGWKMTFEAAGKNYEYRADKYQLRAVNFEGQNYLVQ